MNKVLVEIYVPATGDFFDMFLPVDVPISDVCKVMVDGVGEITNGRYLSSGLEHISLKEPAGLLNPFLTLQDYGVKDGTQFYLI